MTKLRISCPWDTSENITHRLLTQFKTPEINLEEIKFVYDDTYDVCVCFTGICVPVLEDRKYYCFPHEPFWNGSHQKVYPDNCTVFGFCEEGYTGHNIVTPAHTFYGGRGPWVDKLEDWNYEYLHSTSFLDKNKGISSCITDINHNWGLYPSRYNLLSNITDLSFVEFFGVGKHPCEYKNNSPLKVDSVKNFKFTLCVENDYKDNWVTERFFDAILYDCIPIYYGCKNLKEIFPEEGYILLDNIEDVSYVKDTLKHIEKNIDKIYNEKIEQARKIKNRYFKDHNLLEKIYRLCK